MRSAFVLTSLIVMLIALEALENGKNTHKSRVLRGFRGGFGVFGPWSKVFWSGCLPWLPEKAGMARGGLAGASWQFRAN